MLSTMSGEGAVRAAYDAVAAAYDEQLRDELDGKPLDRALLTSFVELVGPGRIADVGCGPGHITRFLARHHDDVLGVDLSHGMVAVAQRAAPGIPFVVASMLDLPVENAAWAGVVALYSIIHFTDDDRRRAMCELGRVVRPNGRLLVSFHVDCPDFAAGDVNHLTTWFGEQVTLDGYFLPPERVRGDIEAGGFAITAELLREGDPTVEYPSRRCYLLGRRTA